jgi:predicted site-specific integrase-resolvase
MDTNLDKPAKLDYTKSEATKVLGVKSRTTIYKYIREGLLKVNKRGRVTAKSLQEMVR